jgi:RHS repeat-associated protein
VLNGVTESYTYDNANKMLTAGTKSYSYDAAGNVTGVTWTGGSRTLTWDAESRLKSTTSGASTVNYAYNGIGQRVAKSGAATAAYLLGDDRIDAEVLSDGSATYAHGVAGLVSENRGGTTKVYHSDALNSVRALTNTSGTVTDSRSTDAFGNVTTTTGTTPTPFGFAGGFGYQQDSETGLMRLGHRMYDSSTGRFISRDPIRDGYNWYVYCDNDPINAVDPQGLDDHPGGINNNGKKPLWVIVSSSDDKHPITAPPGGTVPIPGRPGMVGRPVYPIDENGNWQTPDGNKVIVEVKPGQTIGGQNDLDVDYVWVPGKGWVKIPGQWGWYVPIYTPPFNGYPVVPPGRPGSQWGPPPGFTPIPFQPPTHVPWVPGFPGTVRTIFKKLSFLAVSPEAISS